MYAKKIIHAVIKSKNIVENRIIQIAHNRLFCSLEA